MAITDLEQRLARLEAIEAIKQLKARYFHACDTKQVAGIRECFAPGRIELRYGRIGEFTDREQLVDIFSELACHDHIVEMHHGQNPQIEVHDAGHASGQWGLYYYLIDTRQQTVTQLAGFYRDTYVCRDGQWLISESDYEVASTQIFALSEGLAKVVFAGSQAPAELDDPGKQAR